MILLPRLLSAREDQGAEVISQIAVEFLLLSDGHSHISSFTAFASVDFKNGRRDKKNVNCALAAARSQEDLLFLQTSHLFKLERLHVQSFKQRYMNKFIN